MRTRIVAMSITALLLTLAFVLGVYAGSAGDLDPPSGPNDAASQMYTLEQIYDRLSDGTAGTKMMSFTEPASGPGTGTMYTLDEIMKAAPARDDANGATASDVALGKTFWGLTASAWGPRTGTAKASPDPPCWDNANRYVDCGNGTVHDSVTGLTWLGQADCFGMLDYAAANNAAAGLEDGECGLTDGSSPGDWRLPTREEWQATVARATELDCKMPVLTNTPGTGCYKAGPKAFTGDMSAYYYSSSAEGARPSYAYVEDLDYGASDYALKANAYYVWPVRDGHQ